MRQRAGTARSAWHRQSLGARGLRGGDAIDDGSDVSGGQPPLGQGARRTMSENPFSLWVYLSQSPLLWLTVTLLTYAITDAVSLATGRHPLATPGLHLIGIIGAFLMLTGTSYTTYSGGAQFVHFLLGPATVALAVPLHENRKQVIAAILPMFLALVVGSITAIVSVVLLAEAAGLPPAVVLSLAPKSVPAGGGVGINESLHSGSAPTPVSVVVPGLHGPIIGSP